MVSESFSQYQSSRVGTPAEPYLALPPLVHLVGKKEPKSNLGSDYSTGAAIFLKKKDILINLFSNENNP